MNASVSSKLPERAPEAGELVQVRSRRWLVEEVSEPPAPGESSVVRLACADDERGEWTAEESEAEESRHIEALTAAAETGSARDIEAKLLQETLEGQRGRVTEEIEKYRLESRQIAMDWGDDEQGRRQLEANARHWERRLAHFDADLEREPQRIRRFYDIQLTRVEPVGLVYLWPETN